MPNRNFSGDMNVSPAEMMAGYLVDRKGEMRDAVVTAAALVSRADSWVDPAERRQLFDFLDRNRLAPSTRAETIDAFERRIRELREPGGLLAAVNRLGRHAGLPLVRLVMDAGKEVAAADRRIDPRELHVLELMRVALRAQPLPCDIPRAHDPA